MLPFSSDFIAADGTLVTAFDPAFYSIQGDLQIVSNAAIGNGAGAIDMVGIAESFDPDQFVEATLIQVDLMDAYVGVCVRGQAASSGNGYYWIANGTTYFFGILAAGGFTNLDTGAVSFVDGSILRMEAEGGNISYWVDSVLLNTVADSTYAAGVAGLAAFLNVHCWGISHILAGNLGASVGSVMMPSFVPGL